MYKRLIADDWYTGRQILAEGQRRRNAMISAWMQVCFWANPAYPHGRDDQDGDLLFAHGMSVSGNFAQERELRMLAREASQKGVAIAS